MKRKLYISLLCVILLVTACAQRPPDIYQPPQILEPDNGDYAPAQPFVSQKPESVIVEPPLPEEPEPSMTPEEIRDLLNSIPYAGIFWRRFGANDNHPIELGERGEMIAGFIRGMNGFWRWPSESFHSPENACPGFVFWASFVATNWLQWSDSGSVEGSRYHPELSVLAPHLELGTSSIVLHSHMEETASALFGQKLEIQPLDAFVVHTYEFSGVYVYSLGIFGMGIGHIPIVLHYVYIGDRYEVTCVFVLVSSDAFFDENEDEIPDDELIDWLHTVPGRHTITLKRNADGGFYYWAHILPE